MSILRVAAAFVRRRGARPSAPPSITRFAPEIRPAVARLAARDARLFDLASTFPALLHRLAVRPNAEASRRAIAIVRAGGSLKLAAFEVGTPLWTRKLPPEAFGSAAPDLPDGFWFSRRIVNVLPANRRAAPGWLDAVSEAARWGDERAALWAARESAAKGLLTPEEARLVALHDWFAKRPRSKGGALADGISPAATGRDAGLARAREWLGAVSLFLTLGDGRVEMWLEDGQVDGFDFVAVASRAALVEEARAMNNCLATFGDEIAMDCERVFSVRSGGRRVASLSVYFPGDAPFPQISDLKGPANAAAAPEIWFAARRWLSSQSPARVERRNWDACTIDRARWAEVWRPWWLARRRLPPELPLGPSASAFSSLYAHRPYRRRRRRRDRRA